MSNELTHYEPEEAAESGAEVVVRSAGEVRTESVGRALDAAYAKASTLTLTADEAKALAEDFPDDAFRTGAQGKANLIYIEHAFLRQRLNQVLGVGASVPIRRREWTEQFTYKKDGQEKGGVTIYVDLVLIVRGCVVGEAIGDAVYYPDNASTSYSDALESAKSAAFRRCCKEFGVGLQAWMKGWVDGWHQRNRSGGQRAPQRQEPARKAEPPKRETAKFEPPKDWPDTEIHDLKLWIDSFVAASQFEAALGMFLNEPSIVGYIEDWENLLRHYAEAYKAKYQQVGSKKMNDVIKAALDQMEADKKAAAEFDQQAADAAAGA